MNKKLFYSLKELIKKNKCLYSILSLFLAPVRWLRRREWFFENKVYADKAKLTIRDYARSRDRNCVFYLGKPIHNNLGDLAQYYCILRWIRQNYDCYDLLEFETCTLYDKDVQKALKHIIQEEDVIIIQSGRTFCDRHEDHNMHNFVLKEFVGKKILFMPQTVYFYDKKKLKHTARLFNMNPFSFLLLRDSVSYEKVENLFDKNRLLLFPDIVTTLIGRVNNGKTMKTADECILICKRADNEQVVSYQEAQLLASRLEGNGLACELTDTNFTDSYDFVINNLEQVLLSKIEEFSRARCIITDRFHGMVFSLIANTPVIVLPTIDSKVIYGAKMLKEFYPNSITIVSTLEEAFDIAINQKVFYIENKCILDVLFYDKLKTYFDSACKKQIH